MTITIEGELALIKRKGQPGTAAPAPDAAAAPVLPDPSSPAEASALADLSDTFQAAIKPAPETGLPPGEEEPAWEPTEAVPVGDAGIVDVWASTWRRDTITTDAWGYADGKRRDLVMEMYRTLPPEAQARATASQRNYTSDWRTFEQMVMDEAAKPDVINRAEWGGLPLTQEQFDQRLKSEDQAILADAEAVLAQPGGGLTEFFASMTRSLTKPESLAFLPFGGAASGPAKFILSEMLLSGVASAAALPGQYDAADRLDLPDPDATTQVATEMAFGGLFAGGILGVGKGLNWAMGRERTVIEARPDGENAAQFGAAVDRAEAELTGQRTVQEATKAKPAGSTVRMDFAMGPNRPEAPDQPILDLISAAVEEAIGPGSRVVIVSGKEGVDPKTGMPRPQFGANRHQTGNAADIAIFDAEGNSVTMATNPELMRAVARAAARRGAKGIGLGAEYMGGAHIHIDLVDPGPGQATAWGSEGKAMIGELDALRGQGTATSLNLPPGTVPYNEAAVLRGIVGSESSGNTTARNSNSSAAGLGQILSRTWLELVQKHRPDLMEGRSPNEILALRDDGNINAYMTAMYARDNHAALSGAGLPAGPGELYLAHFMGTTGATRALRAPLDTPISRLMTPKEISANASVRFGGKSFADFTAGDLRRWAARKMRSAYDPNANADMPIFASEGTSRGYTGSGQVATGDGTRVDVDYEVVDYASLIRASGDLQPRDRSQINSDTWIADTAARLDPAQLMPSPNAAQGAPIIGPDNIIESGNGRVSAIGRAYERVPDRAQAYRAAIEGAGYAIPDGVTQPVLVARRRSDLTPAERQRFVIEAQDSSVAQMTPTEVARATARNLASPILARLDPTQPIASAANGDFVRAALATLPRSARNAMYDTNGALNANGQRQLREALFARAWPDPDILARYTEGASPELKSLLEALETAAPNWAALRADIEAGLVSPDMDISPYVLDAMRLIGNARDMAARNNKTMGKALTELLEQVDMLDGAISPLTAALVRKFWSNGRAAPAEQVALFLTRYADEARDAGRVGGMLDAPTPRDVLRTVDPAGFADLPEELGRARGFATPTSPQASMGDDAFTEGAASPEVEAVHLEIETGLTAEPFGTVYDGFTNNPEGAIAHLMARKTGEVRDAFVHPDNRIANVALIYGDEKMGLRHIEIGHPEMIARLPDILRNGRVEADPEGLKRLYLVDDAAPANVAVLRLDWDGAEKTWLLTAFEDNRGKFARQGRTSDVPPASASTKVPDATEQSKDSTFATPNQDPGLTAASDPILDQAAIDNFDAQTAIATARNEGAAFEIKMPDGTTYSAAEVLDDLDADADTDFQITFCTTNSGTPE